MKTNAHSPKLLDEPVAQTLIQIIRVVWDKSARGGELAGKRNAVPLASAVPNELLEHVVECFFVEEQIWNSSNQFAQPTFTQHFQVAFSEPYKYRCLSIDRSSEGIQVRFDGDSLETGAPTRPFMHSLVVGDNQWVRVIWNGRFSYMDSPVWQYEQIVVNIAHFCGRSNGNIFTENEPFAELKSLAHLR